MSPAATEIIDREHMARAIALAARGLHTTDPNPRVGCVLVRDGRIVGEGWHERAGGPHAEQMALQAAGSQARGATAYVSLEPCRHWGRTAPCAEALIGAGVARVVAAMQDPDPRTAGGGLAALRAAGIEVSCGLLEKEAAALNPGFIMRHRRGRPWVRCKLGVTLDGRTATASGESRWITGEAARHDVHLLRARSSAIMTGIGTVLADNPSLTVRIGDAPVERPPLRVIADSSLRLPAAARVLDGPGDTLIAGAIAAPQRGDLDARAGVEVIRLGTGRVDLAALLSLLAERHINEVLLEAGPALCGAMVEAKLVDELVLYVAPKLLGDDARGMFALPGVDRLDRAIALVIDDVRAVGEDWRIVARLSSAE
ncbi:MAG: bifunctional diaminohydroxyphosphoribosylaminopyrimidine deaminase/5-amino-6-(5-phosphoribosylamino)uracil reductase RibD [Gammaproteobacteria bacterium]|jgi:diaminohydroxyphosphoribosylaminopyrimidine deaminase/5-amino-6-(5-phosphoribosylamino)uracil reductase|nr:bifunctional diaminohydroxyphosphoribosylaminopyrimidine deaminase/5-amino-6-(5-phosphoribosylamino)uracil reductase RibD [Gammaproteobacteria bacterium]